MKRSSISVTDSNEIDLKPMGKRRSKVRQDGYIDDEYIDDLLCSDPDDEDETIKEESTVKKKGTRKKTVEEKELKAAELIIDRILAIRMKPKLLSPLIPEVVTASSSSAVTVPSIRNGTNADEVMDIEKKAPLDISADTSSSSKNSNRDIQTDQKDISVSSSSSSTSSSVSSRSDSITATSAIETDGTNILQPSEKNESISSRELLVKYVNKSYRALKWVDEEQIKLSEYSENKLKGFLRVFKRKGEVPYAAETSEGSSFSLESVVDMDWMEVERIVDIFEEEIGVPGRLNKEPPPPLLTDSNGVTNLSSITEGNASGLEKNKKNTSEIAYVKWRGLGYAECTWEAWEEVLYLFDSQFS
jgi:hypothetical protein